MRGRLYGLVAKEFTQVLRDPVMLFIVFWLYSVELIMCTMALGFDVQDLKLGLIDHDRSVASRELVRELTSADTFILVDQLDSMRQAQALVQRGELDVVVVAVHSQFNLARAAMTKRIIRALRHPHVQFL